MRMMKGEGRKEKGRKGWREGGRDGVHVPARAILGRPASSALPAHILAPAKNLCVN